MKKIICFDSWTGGSRHYVRLISAFKSKGMELHLIHLGSWGSDPNRPKQELIDGLAVSDISFYGKMSFLEIIDRLKPAAVLFLSTNTFAHRAFNSYCIYRRIPTMHLYHGLVRVQEVDNFKPYKKNFISQFYFVFNRIEKVTFKVFPNYIKSLITTSAPLSAWSRFVTDIFNLTCGNYIPVAAPDARTTKGAVYVKADIEHATRTYGFLEKNVTAVGNPDLITFGLDINHIGCGIYDETDNQNSIIYIDTGLIYAGAVFDNPDDFLQHLIFTKEKLNLQGIKLQVKLHPHHYTTKFPETLICRGIELIDNDEFVHKIQSSVAAIVEPSTAAMIPALMGKPIFLARYGKLASQAYGEVLTSYPRAVELIDVSNISNMIIDERNRCVNSDVTHWIEENAGPLPAEKMPDRVATIVEEMIISR